MPALRSPVGAEAEAAAEAAGRFLALLAECEAAAVDPRWVRGQTKDMRRTRLSRGVQMHAWKTNTL